MKVIHTVQSTRPGATDGPVEIVYMRDTDAIGAAAGVAGILSRMDEDPQWVETVSIRIEM